MKYLVVAALLAAFIVPSTSLAQTPPAPATTPIMDHNEAWWATAKYMNHHSKTWKLARTKKLTNLADTIEVSSCERILIAKWVWKGQAHHRNIDITKKSFNTYAFRVTSA